MLLHGLIALLPLLAAPALGQEDDDDGQDDGMLGMDLSMMQDQMLEDLGVFQSTQKAQFRTGSPFGPHCFTQKRSHFDGSTEEFCQQYLVNEEFWKPGGPVIIMDNGESPQMDPGRLTGGILPMLAKHTNGLIVVLEHRYYGGSNVTEDLTTDNLRWLNVKESLEDSAEFIRHFPVPKGLELPEPDLLTPAKTPFLYIGGSYPGGRANWMRKHYPDLVWGSIGSSGVVHAQVDFPEYYDSVVKHGEADCVKAITESVATVDRLLDGGNATNTAIKELFGYDGSISDYTFGMGLPGSFGWQQRSWGRSSDKWRDFCKAITGKTGSITIESLGSEPVPAALKAWADIRTGQISKRLAPGKTAADMNVLDHPADDTSLRNGPRRLWKFQTCTEWGYGFAAPRDPNAPRAVSRHVTSDEYVKRCHEQFEPGSVFRIPDQADVSRVNSLGDWGIAADRLATVDGEWDPWRSMAVGAESQPKRENTINRPYWIIPKGGHCWDWKTSASGSTNDEPEDIRKVHEWEKQFLAAWVKQFHDEKAGSAAKPADPAKPAKPANPADPAEPAKPAKPSGQQGKRRLDSE